MVQQATLKKNHHLHPASKAPSIILCRRVCSFTSFLLLGCVFSFLITGTWSLSTTASSVGSQMQGSTDAKPPMVTVGGSAMRSLVLEAAAQTQKSSFGSLQGIYWMEHVNLVVGSNEVAKDFYLNILGLTRDAGKSFHVNLGQQQFHLAEPKDPKQNIQTVAGSIGLAVPNLQSLRQRIEDFSKENDKVCEILSEENDCLTIRGPYGNVFHLYDVQNDEKLSSTQALTTPQKMTNVHSMGGAYGAHRMAVRGQPGIRFLEIACPQGKSPAVARFYREMMGCVVVETTAAKDTPCAVVTVGPGVQMAFVEDDNQEDDASLQQAYQSMQGVHVCFYVNDFEALYDRLASRNLIWTNPRFVHLDTCDTIEEAKASFTLRFRHVIDLETGEPILELEHETRPLCHGQYLKVPTYEAK